MFRKFTKRSHFYQHSLLTSADKSDITYSEVRKRQIKVADILEGGKKQFITIEG